MPTGAGPELHRHAAFFDADGDGKIDLADTYDGLRRLGLPRRAALPLTALINVALGRLTTGSFSLTIDLGRIHDGTHSHDTEAFARDGRFSAAAFDRLFRDAAGGRAVIRESEMLAYLRRNVGGRSDSGPAPVVLLFSALETKVLFALAKTHELPRRRGRGTEPAISRARLRRFYDGTLFPAIARAVRRGRARA